MAPPFEQSDESATTGSDSRRVSTENPRPSTTASSTSINLDELKQSLSPEQITELFNHMQMNTKPSSTNQTSDPSAGINDKEDVQSETESDRIVRETEEYYDKYPNGPYDEQSNPYSSRTARRSNAFRSSRLSLDEDAPQSNPSSDFIPETGFRWASTPRVGHAVNNARVVVSKFSRGNTADKARHYKNAVAAIEPKLTRSNILQVLTDPNGTIADEAHQWQRSLRSIHRRAWYYDLRSIFLIPNEFDIDNRDSPKSATKFTNAITDFSYLRDDDYSDWQLFVRKWGIEEDIEGDIWMEECLWNSMDEGLSAEVAADFADVEEEAQGSLTLLRCIINRIVLVNEQAKRAMLKYIETFDIRKFPGEDVSTATLRIKDVCRALGHSNLPSDTVLRVLEGFMHASTESFRSFCQTQHNLVAMEDYAVSRHDKAIPVYKMLSRVLDMVGKMFVDLKSGDLWVGTSNEARRHSSAFNVEVANEYRAYTIKAGKQVLPFKEWIKTAVCDECKGVGHIRPNCPLRRRPRRDARNRVFTPKVNVVNDDASVSDSSAGTDSDDDNKAAVMNALGCPKE